MLEVKDKDHVRRVRILAKDGVYYIHNDKRFHRMDSLLVHYMNFPVAIVTEDEKCYLYPKRPLVLRPDECLGFGYVSFTASELSFAGESIFIISQKRNAFMRFDSMAMVQTGSRTRIVHRPKVLFLAKMLDLQNMIFLWVVTPPELRPVNLPVTYSPKSQQPVRQWKSYIHIILLQLCLKNIFFNC